MICSALASASSRSAVYAPVDRYFQPPSHTMNTIVADSPSGMLAATFLAIFFIPWFYKLIVDRRLSDRRSTAEIEAEVAHHREQTLRAVHAPRHAPPARGTGNE